MYKSSKPSDSYSQLSLSINENLLPKQGNAILIENFFNDQESDQYFQQLKSEIKWTQEPITVFGKKVMQPRLTALYGDPKKSFSYSGITMQPHAWTKSLIEIKEKIEAVAKVSFTTALLNQYRTGADSMGWHRDNEKELGSNPVIGSVSFGAARTFQFRHYVEKSIKKSIELNHGSFLLMTDQTQHYWEHALPKRTKIVEERINITFRIIK